MANGGRAASSSPFWPRERRSASRARQLLDDMAEEDEPSRRGDARRDRSRCRRRNGWAQEVPTRLGKQRFRSSTSPRNRSRGPHEPIRTRSGRRHYLDQTERRIGSWHYLRASPDLGRRRSLPGEQSQALDERPQDLSAVHVFLIEGLVLFSSADREALRRRAFSASRRFSSAPG